MTTTHGMGRRPTLFVQTVATAILAFASATAAAQSSGLQSVAVPFRGAAGEDGYTSASANVSYAFIACQGEIHIAYSLASTPARVGSSYLFEGKTYPATAAPPTPVTIHFGGTVWRGPAQVGRFSDGLAAAALGMGCFSGQTQEVARIADVVGPNPTKEQVTAYLNSLSIQVVPGEVLKSATQESAIRTELRRAEAAAAAEKRKAEQEAQAQAEREAGRRQAAEAQAAAKSSASTGSSSQGSHTASSRVATAPAPVPPPPTREERIANAIASDKVLANQRLDQQRAALAQQQAAMAAADRRALEAKAALLSPESMQAMGTIAGALEAWDLRVKQRAYLAAQSKLAGQCTLPNGLAAPKDGELRLGVDLSAKLNKRDCGTNSTDRYKAFKLEIAEPTSLQFMIKPTSWIKFTSYMVDVNDLSGKSYLTVHWSEWGAIQKVIRKNVALPAGIYIVKVRNGVEDIFIDFTIRFDPIDATGQLIASKPATIAVAAGPVPASAPSVPTPTELTPVGANGTSGTASAYIGLSVTAGEYAVVSTVDPGGPAAAAGIRPGDEIMRMQTVPQGAYFVRSTDPKNQDHIDTWLRKASPGKFAAFQLRRGGKQMWVTATLGTAQ